MTVTQQSESPGNFIYKAKSGSSQCTVSSSASPPQCLISRLPSGARVNVTVFACASNDTCSLPYETYGYTVPKCKENFNADFA